MSQNTTTTTITEVFTSTARCNFIISVHNAFDLGASFVSANGHVHTQADLDAAVLHGEKVLRINLLEMARAVGLDNTSDEVRDAISDAVLQFGSGFMGMVPQHACNNVAGITDRTLRDFENRLLPLVRERWEKAAA